MAAAASKATLPPIKALILDFDSTISTPTFLKRVNTWCVADNVQLFASMTPEEIVLNFGGPDRIATIKALLTELMAAKVELYIVSIGHKVAIQPHLHKVGLLQPFFEPSRIFGQDCTELRQVNFVKGRLIDQIMKAQGWSHDDVLFVDDSMDHIEKAGPVCRTLHVTSKPTAGGMAQYEFEEIRRAAAGSTPSS